MTFRPLLALALVPLAACGSSGGSGSSASGSIRAAVNATIAAGTAKEEVSSLTPTASATSKSSATGTYSFTNHVGAFAVTTDAFLGNLDVVVSGSTLYIKVPAALLTASKGKPWAGVDMTNPPTVPGAGNVASLAGAADPTRALTQLQEGIVSASKVGAATVGTTAATQYTAKIDLAKAKSAQAASEKTLIGGSTATDDVFIGADNRILRIVSKVNLSGGAVETLTIDYSGYGTPVTTQQPSAADTVDAATLLGQ